MSIPDRLEFSDSDLLSLSAERSRLLSPAAEVPREPAARTASPLGEDVSEGGGDDGFETESDGLPSPSTSSSARARRSPRKVARSPGKRRRVIEQRRRAIDLAKPKRKEDADEGLPWALEALLVKPLEIVVLVSLRLAKLVLSPILDLSKYALWAIIALALAVWLVQQPANFFRSVLSNPLTALTSTVFGLPTLALRAPTFLYCSTVGIGCKRTHSRNEQIALLARTTAAQAHQAHDIFQSVVRLGNPASLGLHHTEMWELAVAVRGTSTLETKEELGGKLMELGNMSRDVKDQVIAINARAINAFSWTVERFKRVEIMISHMQKDGSYSSKAISKQLDSLYDKLSLSLNEVLQYIEATIPAAERASLLGTEILQDLSAEQGRLRRQKEDTPLWRHLLDQTSFKGKQLSRDIKMTQDSIGTMQLLARNLDSARSFLVGYRDNTAQFKAGLTGLHLSDNLLLPAHEVESLRGIMERFTTSVHAVKTGKYSSSPSVPGIGEKPASLWDVD